MWEDRERDGFWVRSSGALSLFYLPPFVLLFLSSAGRPLWGEEAAWWLLRSMRAEHQVAYRGRCLVITWENGESEAILLREFQAADGRRRIEYLSPDRFQGQIIIDDGRQRWQYCPAGSWPWERVSLDPKRVEARWRLLRQNYELSSLSQPAKVAGRETVVITAKPKAQGKGWCKMWLDRERFLPLQVERYQPDGRIASLTLFQDIEFDPRLPDRLFRQETDTPPLSAAAISSQPVSLSALRRAFGPDLPFPERLPLGYIFDSARLRHQPPAYQVHLRYTDGLSQVSLFVTRPARTTARLRPSDKAQRLLVQGKPVWMETNHHFCILTWRLGEVEESIVGDLTPEAMQDLVAALLPSEVRPAGVGNNRSHWLLRLAVLAVVLLLLLRALRRRCPCFCLWSQAL